MRISAAAEQHQAADDGDGQRDLLHDVADRLEDLVEVDDRDVRKPLDEIVLEPRPRRRRRRAP